MLGIHFSIPCDWPLEPLLSFGRFEIQRFLIVQKVPCSNRRDLRLVVELEELGAEDLRFQVLGSIAAKMAILAPKQSDFHFGCWQ